MKPKVYCHSDGHPECPYQMCQSEFTELRYPPGVLLLDDALLLAINPYGLSKMTYP